VLAQMLLAARPSQGIVASGLVLHCDFGDAACYPGSGAAFTDLSGAGNNGTLINGPTYSAANGGQIVFDGIDDLVACGNAASLRATSVTLEVWSKLPSTNTSVRYLFGKDAAHSIITDNKILSVVDERAGIRRSTGIDVCDNAWRQILLATSGTGFNNSIVYINGTAVLTTTTSVLSQSFGVAIGAAIVSGFHSVGSVAIARYYNRALSAAEVLQNFNANRARVGL
jgi:hypothetical protein